MFEGNGFELSNDKFEYARKLLRERNVTITVEEVADNPDLCLADCQENENKLCYPDKLTLQSYMHKKITFNDMDVSRYMYYSMPKRTYSPIIVFADSLSGEDLGVWELTVTVWCFLCQPFADPVAQSLIECNMYLWAEKLGYTSNINTDRTQRSFYYQRKVAKVLIDTFGESAVMDLVDCLVARGIHIA